MHWYQWTDRAFLDDDGKVVEFQSVGRDVTERRRASVLTEPPGRDPGAGRARRAARRDAHDHRAHGRRPLPAISRARVSLLAADGQTLRIGACPSLPVRLLRKRSTTCTVGPRQRLERHRRAPACDRRRRRHLRPIRCGRLTARSRTCPRLRAAWSTPILASDGHTVLGTLDVYAASRSSPDAEHQQILSLLAHLASIAIERKAFEERLAHQSMHDPLTGLPNRLLFLDRLEPRDRPVPAHAPRGRGPVPRPRPVQERQRQRRPRRRRRAARRGRPAARVGAAARATRWRASAATSSRSSATTSRPRPRAIARSRSPSGSSTSVAEPFVVGGARPS